MHDDKQKGFPVASEERCPGGCGKYLKVTSTSDYGQRATIETVKCGCDPDGTSYIVGFNGRLIPARRETEQQLDLLAPELRS